MFLGEESKQSSHVDWIIRDGARQLLQERLVAANESAIMKKLSRLQAAPTEV